ncbi:MAG: hypothetical protein V2A65_07810 [Candidatus Omnitrophota bacterium]
MKNKPFYLILYQDIKAAEEKVAGIKAAVFPDARGGRNSFNDTVLFGGETDIEQVIAVCQTPSFGGGQRFVLVRRAERFTKEDREKLFNYLKKPSPASLPVFLFQADKKTRFPFVNNQISLFFSGEKSEFADNFGVVHALQNRKLNLALRIIDYQYGDERDFPRFFGLLVWHLRNRIERQGRLTRKDADLFRRLYTVERDFRRGKFDGRTSLELTIFGLYNV